MFWIKKRYMKKANDKCLAFIKANYAIKKVVNWECPYNYRCHINSIQYAKKHKWASVYSCYQITENWWIISHFINYHKGKYLETTQWRLGVDSCDYYVVKKIQLPERNSSVDSILESLKDNIFNVWYTNRFLNRWFDLTPYWLF